VATAILGYQRFQRESRIHRLKDSIPELENEDDDALRKVGIDSYLPAPLTKNVSQAY
jgi:hypothetical protein